VLFVLEAMKLESEILSPIDGVIQELYVKVGQKVDANQPLLIIG
jgi:pyruvate carboxylase subunit B